MAVTLHTSLGDIKLEIFCSEVKKLSFNFLALCASGAYDNTKFHRNQKNFVVQGGTRYSRNDLKIDRRTRTHTGDPTGTGKGGESIHGGYLDDEFAPGLKHTMRGVVGMASRGPNTNGSQFYITYKKLPHLDNVFSVIGRVIHGFEILDVMERQPVKGKKFRPVNEIILKKVTIHANPLAT